MTNIDLNKAYNSQGNSVHDLFDKLEEGFYVPYYQREYTWEEDNINQLFDDLLLGIQDLTDPTGDNTVTFLGTTILTTLKDKSDTVKPGESIAQPSAVTIVIDGQQRISTISLLAIQIKEHIESLITSLPQKPPYTILHNHFSDLIESLIKLYTMRLGRGADPTYKPKIIRAQTDRWTHRGDDSSYESPVAHYVATYIRTKDPQQAYDSLAPTDGARVRGNIKLIDQWLDHICNAHVSGTELYDQFPVGERIATDRMQTFVLGFTDERLKVVIEKTETNEDENDYFASSIYHLFVLAYYLTRRCGVNRLEPSNPEWGFDMFQALNATGTPLTAMETFLPQVMQAEMADGNKWRDTPSYRHIEEIDELFKETTSNQQKNQRTNELLGAFALCYEGEKLGNKFSGQRRWMTRIYEKKLQTIGHKRYFLANLARVATFYHVAWYMEEVDTPFYIRGLEGHSDGELASLLVQYLKAANSKLSAPVLAWYYSHTVANGIRIDDFVAAAKACAAFFTLWRSANSTSGLDNVYRKFFVKNNWEDPPDSISTDSLKKHFWNALTVKGITTKGSWIKASDRFLLYTEVRALCRFVLFLTGHDREPDNANPGLTIPGNTNLCSLLNLSSWLAKDFKTLEHVAPQRQRPGDSWDKRIYADNKVHVIGNLILLPRDINRLVTNRSWAVKFVHYSHVGGRSQGEIKELRKIAKNRAIQISKKATNILTKTSYSCAVSPILKIGINGPWNARMIDRRTRHIKELAWDILVKWLKA